MRIDRAADVQPIALRAAASRAAGVHGVDSIARIAPSTPKTGATKLASLVAGVVPGAIDFSTPTPRPTSSAAIPMYRSDSQVNAAATSLALGRVVDLSA